MATSRRKADTDKPRGTWEGYWTEEENRFIRENYTVMSDQDMADLLGKTRKAVRSHRSYMGLLRQETNTPWTIEEVMYLDANWGHKTLRKIAKHLGKTEQAVRDKAKQGGYGRQINGDEMLNKEQVCKLMGLECREVVDRWIEAGLPVVKMMIGVNVKKGRRTFIIKFDDLLEFLEEHPEQWDSRRLPEYALGIEYDWLRAKRQADSQRVPLPREWTKTELSLLKSRVARKIPYKDIARDLGRSVTAVRSMAYNKGYCVRHIQSRGKNT